MHLYYIYVHFGAIFESFFFLSHSRDTMQRKQVMPLHTKCTGKHKQWLPGDHTTKTSETVTIFNREPRHTHDDRNSIDGYD